MKPPSAIFLAALVPFMSGCATLRPAGPSTPIEVSGRTIHPPPSPAAPRVKLPEGPLSLRKAIEIGLAGNPELAALGWDAEAAQARRDQASGERFPRIGAVAGYTHYLDAQRLLPAGLPGDPALMSQDIVSGDIVMSMPIFTGGRLINQVRAADLLRQAAAHRFSRSREELVFNISSVFFGILAQQRVIGSLEFSFETLRKHADRIDALIAAQKAAKVDRMRTEVQSADIRQQLSREKSLMNIQHRVLANFLGLKERIDTISLQGELESREKSVVPDLETSLAAARKNRDDYLAARTSIEALARNVDAAEAGRWPSVSLRGSYGARWAVGRTRGTGDNAGDVGGVGLALEVPLIDGGRVSAHIREQRAGFAAARHRLHKLELQIRLEVETAMANIQSSEERLEAMLKAIDQAGESLRIERQKYDLGKGAIVDVLDAQSALLKSETTYYRILAEYHTAIAQLKLARGEE